jgi:hypothetical protein
VAIINIPIDTRWLSERSGDPVSRGGGGIHPPIASEPANIEFLFMNDLQPRQDSGKSYAKIGGWLILYAVGLVLYPAQTLFLLVTVLLPAVFSDNWAALTSPTNPGYHTLWAPLVIFEFAGSIGFFLCSIFIVIFFFQRRRWVPKLVIFFLIANVIFVGTDYFIINFFLIRTNSVNVNATINFVRTVVAGAIWIPYFMFSSRVEKTFTE